MSLTCLLLFHLSANIATADSLPVSPDSSVQRVVSDIYLHKGRLWAVGATSLLTLGSSYVYLERTWWHDKGVPFHFDEGRDLTYASGLDKVAHLEGGIFVS